MPYARETNNYGSELHRKTLDVPHDNGTFIKPLKQSFVRNARMMNGTRIMLALLAGWSGKGTTIKTSMCVIGKHLGRSTRQVFRYLKDASEEGYLLYSKTKDRMGYITGIRIWLNFGAIKHSYGAKKKEKRSESPRTQAMTYTSDINPNSFLNTIEDHEIGDVLTRFAQSLGLQYKPDK